MTGPGGGAPASEAVDDVVEHRYAELATVRLHYVEAGEGPCVVLLHGFPEFWYSWRHQIVALCRAGFRVVAPDLRGYNLSDKPPGVAAYSLPLLADDIAALVEQVADRCAALVGHDWGAPIAWGVASRRPDKLERLIVVNGPHPARYFQLLRHPRQMARSSYMLAFQLPLLPERVIAGNDFAWLRKVIQANRPTTAKLRPHELERYVEAWRQPGALRAALNYYRAAARSPLTVLRACARPFDGPALVVWGDRDAAMIPEQAEQGRWASKLRVEHVDAGHWVQEDRAEDVNRLILGALES